MFLQHVSHLSRPHTSHVSHMSRPHTSHVSHMSRHSSHVWFVVPSTSNFLLSLLTFILQTTQPHNNITTQQHIPSTCLVPITSTYITCLAHISHSSYVWFVVLSTSNFLLLSLLAFILQTTQPHNNITSQQHNHSSSQPLILTTTHPHNHSSSQHVPSTYLAPVNSIHFNQHFRHPNNQPSNEHFNPIKHPLRSLASSTNNHQSGRGGLYSFRTIGRLHQQPPVWPWRALQLQDNRQTGQTFTLINHLDHPLRAPISISLAVAGFGFRTIGRLVTIPSTTYFDHPLQSPASSTNIHQSHRGGLRSFRTIGRLSGRGGLRLQDNRQTGNNPSHRGGLRSFRTIGRLSGRGGLRLQDNRQTGDNPFNQPLRSPTTITRYNHPLRAPTSTSLTVAGFAASGQSADCLAVAGFGFRTIGRLLQDNRQTGDNPFNQPLQSPTTITRFEHQHPPVSPWRASQLQDNRQTGDNPFNQPLRSPTTITRFEYQQHPPVSPWRALQLQDNRQTGQPSTSINYPLRNPPPHQITKFTSLAVAGSGFRTIGRLSGRGGLRLQDNRQTGDDPFNQPPTSLTHYNHPLRVPTTSTSLAVAGFGFRTIGRLITIPSTTHFSHPLQSPASSTNNIHQSGRGGLRLQDNRQTVSPWRASQLQDNRRLVTTPSINHPPDPLRSPASSTNNIHQSGRGGLYSFRTIGRLVNQPSHPIQSTIQFNQPSNSINHLIRSIIQFNQPSNSINHLIRSTIQFDQSSNSINHPIQLSIHFNSINHPLQPTVHFNHPSTSNTHINQSDRGGLQLEHNRQASQSAIHLNQPSTSIIQFNHLHQSGRGGLRLQDNRQTGRPSTLTIPFKQTSTIVHPY
ncbi:hypothetical protein N7527_001650 [Penicillium freii]|nr:hypothetical protein N7527_001650 [Penicillium freii]